MTWHCFCCQWMVVHAKISAVLYILIGYRHYYTTKYPIHFKVNTVTILLISNEFKICISTLTKDNLYLIYISFGDGQISVVNIPLTFNPNNTTSCYNVIFIILKSKIWIIFNHKNLICRTNFLNIWADRNIFSIVGFPYNELWIILFMKINFHFLILCMRKLKTAGMSKLLKVWDLHWMSRTIW